MSTPHKHAEYIKALAEGISVDVRQVGSGLFWHRLIHFFPFDDAEVEFRLTPHKWQKEIDALKAGKEVQGRTVGHIKWIDVLSANFENTGLEFRVKPEVVRFRVVIFKTSTGAYFTSIADTESHEKGLQESPNFVRWIGDWQEVEV